MIIIYKIRIIFYLLFLSSMTIFIVFNWIFLLLSFNNSLYMLDTSPLSDLCFAIVFFYFVFYFLSVFLEQEFYILIKSNISVLVLQLKTVSQRKVIKIFAIFFRSFTVVHFTFKSISIHFELNFVKVLGLYLVSSVTY